MRIECPTCNIGFNVSDDQVGTKGLCPKCETKFIIPADPDDEVEVLAEGKIEAGGSKKSADESEDRKEREKKSSSKSKSKPRPATEPLDDEEDDERIARKKRKKSSDSSRISHRDEDDGDLEEIGSGAGKALGLLALGLVLGLVIGFALGRMTAGGGDSGGAAPATEKDPFGLEGGDAG